MKHGASERYNSPRYRAAALVGVIGTLGLSGCETDGSDSGTVVKTVTVEEVQAPASSQQFSNENSVIEVNKGSYIPVIIQGEPVDAWCSLPENSFLDICRN